MLFPHHKPEALVLYSFVDFGAISEDPVRTTRFEPGQEICTASVHQDYGRQSFNSRLYLRERIQGGEKL